MPLLGIIAGGGSLPSRLVDSCRAQGRPVFVLGLKGQAQIKPDAWAELGATDAAIRILKDNGVDTVVMAGAVRRPSLAEMKPDLRTVKLFAKLGMKALGDDALLRAVAGELEKDGFTVIGAHEVDATLLSPEGLIGTIAPNAAQQADIALGIKAARMLGALDAGQAVAVQQGVILGLEGVEGTDALIRRCGELRRKGASPVLVKCCKPGQDKRLDLPTVGIRTLRNCHAAGIGGVAVEAGASVLLDRADVAKAADALGIFLTGFAA
jgi:UDP-2,3-diacylglucosamine hydrolase